MTKSAAIRSELYRRPLSLLSKTDATPRNIVPSVKLSRRSFTGDRYYIDLTTTGPKETASDVAALAEGLCIPGAAKQRLEQELREFGVLRFVGVTAETDHIVYKIYLGFSGGKSNTDGATATSIDFTPGGEGYTVKRYHAVPPAPRLRQLEILRRSLSTGERGLELRGDALLTYELCSEILRKAQGPLSMTRTLGASDGRHSVAFNYAHCVFAFGAEIKQELDAIVNVFGIDKMVYGHWYDRMSEYVLVDVSTGLGSDGEPFVTVYHGFLAEPPELSTEPPATPPPSKNPPVAHPAGCPSRTSALAHTDKPELSPAADPSAPSQTAAPGPPTDQRPPQMVATRGACEHRLIYTIGTIGYTFMSRAHRDSLRHDVGPALHDPVKFAGTLKDNPSLAKDIVWTLLDQGVPVYAIVPIGPFAELAYLRLIESLRWWSQTRPWIVAIAGWAGGMRRVLGDLELPIVYPDLCGTTLLGSAGDAGLLDRLVHEVRGPGTDPRDRARAFVVANLHRLEKTISEAGAAGFALNRIDAEPSSVAGPGMNAWDITMTLFDPRRRANQAQLRVRCVVDVGEIAPRFIGTPRTWHQFAYDGRH